MQLWAQSSRDLTWIIGVQYSPAMFHIISVAKANRISSIASVVHGELQVVSIKKRNELKKKLETECILEYASVIQQHSSLQSP